MTTAERRLSALEAALSSTERIKRWLAEAQAFDDFDGYCRSIYPGGVDALPLDRLAREAKEGAEATSRGRPREGRDRAVRTAIMGTVFRFQLALRTIVLADETLQREALTQGLLCAQIGLLLVEDGQLHQSPFPSSEAGFGTLRNLALARVAELHALGTARARVEARFFDGMAVLFPAMAREWAEQVERSELVALSAVRLAELDGIAPPPPDDPEALEARVSQLVADLVEPARSKAFDEIGDGRRAASIAIRWLQPKLGAAAS